jgi:integrase
MNDLTRLLDDYLTVRRAAGYSLVRAEKLLRQFLRWLASQPETGPLVFTASQALAWAAAPGAGPGWWQMRLGVVRSFALWLLARDIPAGVPSLKTLPRADRRVVPHMYSETDVAALMGVCGELFTPFRAATMQTLTGLLAVTGMRVGEVIALDTADVDLGGRRIRVRQGKSREDRLVFLEESSRRAVAGYLSNPLRPPAASPALLVSSAGTRLLYCNVQRGFARMAQAAHLAPQPGARPTLHSLRHSYATRIIAGAYRPGSQISPERALTLLADWLGHAAPASTYWYVEASPELAGIAAARLEPSGKKTKP